MPCAAGSSLLDRAGEAPHNLSMSEPTTNILALIAGGDLAGLQAALGAGGDAQVRDRWGVTALMHGAARGHLEIVDLLLEHGADAAQTSHAGNSALMAAVARGHLDVAARLLDAGCDAAHQNKWGLSAYDWAVWPSNSAETVNLLQARAG